MDEQRGKYDEWATKHGLMPQGAGESTEECRRRLVWEYERRRRGVSNSELNKIVRENQAANAAMDWARTLSEADKEKAKRTPPRIKVDELETLVGRG